MKTKSPLIALLICLCSGTVYSAFSQTLQLIRTVNYGRHIMDIDFSKQAPYPALIYVYKIHPSEQAAAVFEMVSDKDTNTPEPPPVIDTPKVEYAVQIPGMPNSRNLGAGEFCEFLSDREMITESPGDTILKRYSVMPNGIKCTDSIIVPSPKNGSNLWHNTTPDGKFYLTQKTVGEDIQHITFYDSALQSVISMDQPHEKSDISFIDEDRFVIVNWTDGKSNLNIQEYSLSKGKIRETELDLPGNTFSWGVGSCPVNDTLSIVWAQMADWRETFVYAMNLNGKIYWRTEISDYADEVNVMQGARKIACKFYNLQQVSTIRFYSLLTGKWESTLNLQSTLPEFATRTSWPVYLPMKLNALPGGKWAACLVNCYSPDNSDISAYYLLVSNGTKTLKAKLHKSKNITSTDIIPFSENELAVIIDDDIYYYMIK